MLHSSLSSSSRPMQSIFSSFTGRATAVFLSSAAITSFLISRPAFASAQSSAFSTTSRISQAYQQRLLADMKVTPYTQRYQSWPYSPKDFQRQDSTNDSSFYSGPRFVTHIDDGAIQRLRAYYNEVLPSAETAKGSSILDFCSSWISHFPDRIQNDVLQNKQSVILAGMVSSELKANPLAEKHADRQIVADLNEDPDAVAKVLASSSSSSPKLIASTCTVSIDYLTKPVEVLSSLRKLTVPDGTVHLAVSNRCFPTKVIGRWLRVDEDERLQMVGDYLWFAGWRDIEIVDLPPAADPRLLRDGDTEANSSLARIMAMFGQGAGDPLWVVRGVNQKGDADKSGEKSEL